MKITKTPLGLYLIKPEIFKDSRGYFFESYSERDFDRSGLKDTRFVQDNVSFSDKKGTLRGLHYQIYPYNQGKLIQVLSGEIYDVSVNIDSTSVDFGKWEAHILNRENSLFIPDYFAHGYQTLTDNSQILYKVTNLYNKTHEVSIIYNDKDLDIPWSIDNPIISEKDLTGIEFKDINK